LINFSHGVKVDVIFFKKKSKFKKIKKFKIKIYGQGDQKCKERKWQTKVNLICLVTNQLGRDKNFLPINNKGGGHKN